MLYNKPKDVTYTQMAITIDKMAYSEDCDDELIYQYLYLLSYMLAVKACYFTSSYLYNDFSILVANTAFMRLKNPKQFQLNENGEPRLKKIKSILNYLKTILYPKKVDFEQENYAQVNIYIEELEEEYSPGFTFANMLSNSAESLMKIEFQCCLQSIASTFRFYLRNIPYKYNSPEWYNIYVSCLLTFLNSITLSKKELDSLQQRADRYDNLDLAEKLYTRQQEDVILYHLDVNMKDYIRILVRKVRSVIAKELSELLDTDIDSYNMNTVLIRKEINSSYQNTGV